MKKLARRIVLSCAMLFLCLLAVPSQKADAAAKINKTKVTVYAGNTTKLKVSGTSKKVTWTSSNKSVATVKNGTVTAKKKGTTTITAKVGTTKLTCKVTVKNIALSKKSVTLNETRTTTLKVTGAFKKVTWKSSNKNVATVKNGVVTAVAKGKAKITATHNGKTYTCTVTVNECSTVLVKVDRDFTLYMDQDEKKLFNSYVKQLNVKSKTKSGNFTVYKVTKKSYTALLENIKKDLKADINTFLGYTDTYTKIKFNTNCTKLYLYMDLTATGDDYIYEDDAAYEAYMNALMSITYDCMFYQLFNGVTAENMDIAMNMYDAATNELIFSL